MLVNDAEDWESRSELEGKFIVYESIDMINFVIQIKLTRISTECLIRNVAIDAHICHIFSI